MSMRVFVTCFFLGSLLCGGQPGTLLSAADLCDAEAPPRKKRRTRRTAVKLSIAPLQETKVYYQRLANRYQVAGAQGTLGSYITQLPLELQQQINQYLFSYAPDKAVMLLKQLSHHVAMTEEACTRLGILQENLRLHLPKDPWLQEGHLNAYRQTLAQAARLYRTFFNFFHPKYLDKMIVKTRDRLQASLDPMQVKAYSADGTLRTEVGLLCHRFPVQHCDWGLAYRNLRWLAQQNNLRTLDRVLIGGQFLDSAKRYNPPGIQDSYTQKTWDPVVSSLGHVLRTFPYLQTLNATLDGALVSIFGNERWRKEFETDIPDHSLQLLFLCLESTRYKVQPFSRTWEMLPRKLRTLSLYSLPIKDIIRIQARRFHKVSHFNLRTPDKQQQSDGRRDWMRSLGRLTQLTCFRWKNFDDQIINFELLCPAIEAFGDAFVSWPQLTECTIKNHSWFLYDAPCVFGVFYRFFEKLLTCKKLETLTLDAHVLQTIMLPGYDAEFQPAPANEAPNQSLLKRMIEALPCLKSLSIETSKRAYFLEKISILLPQLEPHDYPLTSLFLSVSMDSHSLLRFLAPLNHLKQLRLVGWGLADAEGNHGRRRLSHQERVQFLNRLSRLPCAGQLTECTLIGDWGTQKDLSLTQPLLNLLFESFLAFESLENLTLSFHDCGLSGLDIFALHPIMPRLKDLTVFDMKWFPRERHLRYKERFQAKHPGVKLTLIDKVTSQRHGT